MRPGPSDSSSSSGTDMSQGAPYCEPYDLRYWADALKVGERRWARGLRMARANAHERELSQMRLAILMVSS